MERYTQMSCTCTCSNTQCNHCMHTTSRYILRYSIAINRKAGLDIDFRSPKLQMNREDAMLERGKLNKEKCIKIDVIETYRAIAHFVEFGFRVATSGISLMQRLQTYKLV
jgi:hypothetical protein